MLVPVPVTINGVSVLYDHDYWRIRRSHASMREIFSPH
jgi:hypothetical protein